MPAADPGGPGDERLPRPLGRYRLTAILGQGAMGVVYRAHDPVIDRPVAIKIVRAELLDPEGRQEFLDRFRQEVRAAGRCNHPNIVAVHDFSDDPLAPYIVMELVDGVTLQQRLRAGPPLTPAESVAIACQMLDALGYAHGQGIIHRDVKPANVITLPGGRIKLMDFGVARLGGANLTQIGTMIGTLRYMAPEQAAGRDIDPRADLFSAAVVVFEMLTGLVPFPGASATELLLRLTGPEPVDLAPMRGGLAGFAPVFRRALAKDPAGRFARAAEFAAALRAVSAGPAADDATVIRPAGPPPGARDGALLDSIEKSLATIVGPMARVLVRQAAAETTDPGALVDRLATGLQSAADRERFRAGAGQPVAAPAAPPAPPATLPQEAVAAAQALLASHIGPIAKLVTRDAARQAASLSALCDLLAGHLPRPQEQALFRQRFKTDIESKFRT